MCGIAAEFRKRETDQTELDTTMKNVLRMIQHRGPDGTGIWKNTRAALGHQRLSIIDLSNAGAQPYHDASRKVHLVFNGEIYNYQELRPDLEKNGYQFVSHSDTEVLLALYLQKGSACVQSLRGMFAFAIYDERSETVLLARDRMGKKPLYYSFDESRLCLCSELKAFHKFGLPPPELNPTAIYSYLRFQYIMGKETIYNNIYRLGPGCIAEIDLKKWKYKETPYWDVLASAGKAPSYSTIEKLIEESVNYRLIADVEVGILLSGGIDSTIISHFAKKNSLKSPRAFFVSFDEDQYDESEYAKQAAKALDIDLTIISGSLPSFDVIRDAVYHADEPLGDPAIIPTYLISEALSKYVKVVLSGEGADELFWGYPHYQRERLSRKYFSFVNNSTFQSIVHALNDVIGSSDRTRRVGKLTRALQEQPFLGSTRWTTTFSQTEVEHLFAEKTVFRTAESNVRAKYALVEQHALNSSVDQEERAVANELYYWLPDDLLIKVDRMTMAHSVEARAPFLDQEVVAASMSLAWHEKADLRKTKKPLRQLLQDRLGKSLNHNLIHRRKHGFEVPLERWVRQDYRSEFDHLFSIKNVSRFPILRPEGVVAYWNNFLNRPSSSHEAKKIWLLACLMLWYEFHENGFESRETLST